VLSRYRTTKKSLQETFLTAIFSMRDVLHRWVKPSGNGRRARIWTPSPGSRVRRRCNSGCAKRRGRFFVCRQQACS